MKNVLVLLMLLVCRQSVLSAQSVYLDNTFGLGGTVTTNFYGWDYCTDMAIQNDGKIVLIGFSDANVIPSENFLVARYTEDGFPDSSFSQDGFDTTGLNNYLDEPSVIAIQPDGKIVLSGKSYNLNSDMFFGTVRYNTDGTLDSSFGAGGKVSTLAGNSFMKCEAVDFGPGGKIIIGGQLLMSTYDAIVIRYNSDGSPDSSFGGTGIVIPSLPDRQIFWSLAYQPDGKILAGGWSGTSVGLGGYPGGFFMMRFDSAGTLDSSFNGNGIMLDTIAGVNAPSMILQPDGKIILGGTGRFQSNNHFALARYLPDGSPDSTFGLFGRVLTIIGNASSGIADIALQPDGKILAAGNASNWWNNFILVRYNSDGSIDSSFGMSGVIRNPIGPSTNNVASVSVQPSGKIVIAGWSYLNMNPDFSMLRYDQNIAASTTLLTPGNPGIKIFPNPSFGNAWIHLESNPAEKHWMTVYNSMGKRFFTTTFVGNEYQLRENLSAGMYMVSITDDAGRLIYSARFIKE